MPEKYVSVSNVLHRKLKVNAVVEGRKIGDVTDEAVSLGLAVLEYWPEGLDRSEGPKTLMALLHELSGCSPDNKGDLFPAIVVKLGGHWD